MMNCAPKPEYGDLVLFRKDRKYVGALEIGIGWRAQGMQTPRLVRGVGQDS